MVKGQVSKDMMTVLKEVDRDILENTVSGKNFKSQYFVHTPDSEIRRYIALI